MTRFLVMVGLVLVLIAGPQSARANGDPVPTAAPPPPTHYERFVRSACLPCVQESHPVKTVALSPVKLPSIPLGLPPGVELPSRPGQVGFEVVRAYELGRPTRQLLAVRVTIAVGMGSVAGQLFPLGFGMLDAEDAADLAFGIAELAKNASVPARDGAGIVDIDYHVGSLRVGIVRVPGDVVAYVQVGDIPLLALRPVWQVPTTVFLSASELPTLKAALTDVLARIRTLRGS